MLSDRVKRRVPLLAVVIAAAAGLFVVGTGGNRPQDSAPAAASDDQPADRADAAPDRELQALKRRIARLEADLDAQRAARTAAAASVPPPASAPERDPAVLARERAVAAWVDTHYTPEVQSRIFGSYFAEVDELRLAEPRDEQWAANVQRGMHKLLEDARSVVGAARLEQVDCGSTLCRMRIEVEHARTRRDLVRHVQRELHFDEASALIQAEDDVLEMCLAREGASLPVFDQLRYAGDEMARLGVAPEAEGSMRREN